MYFFSDLLRRLFVQGGFQIRVAQGFRLRSRSRPEGLRYE